MIPSTQPCCSFSHCFSPSNHFLFLCLASQNFHVWSKICFTDGGDCGIGIPRIRRGMTTNTRHHGKKAEVSSATRASFVTFLLKASLEMTFRDYAIPSPVTITAYLFARQRLKQIFSPDTLSTDSPAYCRHSGIHTFDFIPTSAGVVFFPQCHVSVSVANFTSTFECSMQYEGGNP